MALQDPQMRDLYDLKLFVNCDSDLMLARRIRRDTVERGRDVEGILDQVGRHVSSLMPVSPFRQEQLRQFRPAVVQVRGYCESRPTHLIQIVPGSNNETAIELLVTHLQRQLDSRTLRFRRELVNLDANGPEDATVDENVRVIPQTNQLLGIMTILRDAQTKRTDFIFNIDRLA